MSRIKEFMKDWLVEHERLYWYIVIGFAVFAFGFITMLGLAKLEKANAATHETEVVVAYKGASYSIPLGEYDYYLVFYDSVYSEREVVLLSKSPIERYLTTWGPSESGTRMKMYQLYDKDAEVIVSEPGSVMISSYSTARANHDVVDSETGEVVFCANPFIPAPPPTQYSPDAPYLQYKSHTSKNAYFSDYNTNFNNSYIEYTFDVVPLENYVSREVQFTGYVYLPSKGYIDFVWSEYCNENLGLYKDMDSGSYYSQWIHLLEYETNTVAKKFPFKITVSDVKDLFYLKLSHEDIISAVESYNGFSIKDYYDLTGSRETVLTNLIKSYIWVSRLDGIVFTTYGDCVNYGRLVSVSFFANMNPVVYETTNDPLFVGPGIDIDSDVSININQAYKDALQEALKDNEQYLGSLDDAFDNLSGSDLWAGFKNLSNGLAGMAPAIAAISALTGAVFAFLPMQITGIVSFTLLALCIIAIIKAIRG